MHYEIGNRRGLGLSNWWVGLFLIGIFKKNYENIGIYNKKADLHKRNYCKVALAAAVKHHLRTAALFSLSSRYLDTFVNEAKTKTKQSTDFPGLL